MEIIISGRGTGKTKRIIEMAAEEGGYIVCMSPQEAQRIARLAQSMGLKIPFPITPPEFKAGQYYPLDVKQFYIDNADMLLQVLPGVPIRALTMTKEDTDAIS